MHTFQPFSLDMLELNPFTKFDKEWAALVTASDHPSGANAMTVSWGAMGTMWGRPCVTVYVRESRFTHELIEKADYFSLNFFSEDQKKALKILGSISGRDEDKIAECKLNTGFDHKIPYIDEANLLFFCKKLSATPINPEDFVEQTIDSKWYSDHDYHTMYIAEVVKAAAR